MNIMTKAALCGAFFVTPIAALADDCAGVPTQTHTVRVEYQGFFPSTVYVCAGDTIRFQNESGRWAGFNISDGSDGDTSNDFSYYWTQTGTSRDYYVDADSGLNFINFDLWGADPYYDGNGQIVFGTPPSS